MLIRRVRKEGARSEAESRATGECAEEEETGRRGDGGKEENFKRRVTDY